MIKRAVAIGGLVILAGCNRPELADYFPLVPGAQRIMRVHTMMVAGTDTSETTRVRLVQVVRGEKELPGIGKVWVVEAPRDSGQPAYTYFLKHDDGVIQVLPMQDRKPVELLYLALPLSKGLKWYDTKDQREMMEVVAKETVAVAAGKFPDCFQVLVTSTKADWSMRQWLAPDIGPVKSENRAAWTGKDGVKRSLVRTTELVSYLVPKKAGN